MLNNLVLELRQVSVSVESREEGEGGSRILDQVSLKLPRRHFCAVVGPSGCGKSTLLKVIAGVMEADEGELFWDGRNLQTEEDLSPSEIGYVPQFGIAYDRLTVFESVRYAMLLRISHPRDVEDSVEGILEAVGLDDAMDRLVEVLSGGQKRRLAMALELVSNPDLLLCDEVTSGLDPQAEKDMVRLLHQVSQQQGRLVVSVTHSLSHLDLYDSVMVLYRGVLAYHGPPEHLLHYFSVESAEQIYPQLSRRSALGWQTSWAKHGAPFSDALLGEDRQIDEKQVPTPPALDEPEVDENVKKEQEKVADDPGEKKKTDAADQDEEGKEEEALPPATLDAFHAPGFMVQTWVLLMRRWKILLRSPGQIWLQLGLILGFPALVAVFALDGLPQIKNLSMERPDDLIAQARETLEYQMQSIEIGSLVSGLVMFQVILLTLMGANNSAREVAGERLILEKEKLAGLRVGSYVISRAIFLAVVVAVQSVWMTLFVHRVCDLPGTLAEQMLILFLVNAAMTSVCLAVSSMMRSSEQASLVSIYFVGFQLPLSGAVLALPELLSWVTRPFIAAYWGWSGYIQTLRGAGSRHYDVVREVSETDLSAYQLAVWVLVCHIVIGIFVAWVGCSRSRWDR